MNKKRKYISSIVIIALLITSAGSLVYSWIIGDVTPNVRGDFSVGSSSGLVLTLGKNDGIVADLNEYFGLSTDTLELNECSSYDGETIYARDYKNFFVDKLEKEIICLNEATKAVVGTSSGDYLEAQFTLRLSYVGTESYYIYFLDGFLGDKTYHTGFTKIQGSTITTEGLNALRVALYVDGLCNSDYQYDESAYGPALFDSTAKTPKFAIFTNTAETNPTSVKTVSQLALPLGTTAKKYNVCQKVYTSATAFTNYGTYGTPTLLEFSDYALNNGSDDVVLKGDTLPENANYLFKLSQAYPSVNITIRVWLEGLSQYCADGKIAPNDGVRMCLYFVSYRLTSSS